MRRVLIADDSAGKIGLVRTMLERHGWPDDPLVAGTTEDAMALIDGHHITHAFIDFYIPSRNGPAVIAYLKERNPQARVALVSSSDKTENADAARKAGAEAVICTSYASDDVEEAFKNVLDAWRDGMQ